MLHPELGPANLQKLLNDWETVQRSGADAGAVTLDMDMFREVLANAGLEWAYDTPNQRAQAGGKALSFERKREIAVSRGI